MNIIEEIIYPVLDQTKDEEALEFENSKDLVLYGEDDGLLDSLMLIDFIVEIQDRISDLTGKDVKLVTTEALQSVESPFRTVKSLSEYIEELLK